PPAAIARYTLLLLSSHPAPTEIYTLSLHDALPISGSWKECSSRSTGISFFTIRSSASLRIRRRRSCRPPRPRRSYASRSRVGSRSEEHTSELQSRENLVCRLLLEKKKCK